MTAALHDDLAARIGGSVLREGDEGRAGALLLWNGMASAVPLLVVRPSSAADATYAREQGEPLSVKGVLLEMSGMSQVAVDPAARSLSPRGVRWPRVAVERPRLRRVQ